MAVSDLPAQKTRHYFCVLFSRHFVRDDLDCFRAELRRAFKYRRHNATYVFCSDCAQLCIPERKTEAVAAIRLTSRGEIIQEIFVIKRNVNEREWRPSQLRM